MKTPVLVVILLVIIAAGGDAGFRQYQQHQKAEAIKKEQAARQQEAARQADALAKKQAAEAATRKEVNDALKAVKVSSLTPGQPGIVIIDKQEYAEGDDLLVAKGRKLRVTKVQEDGVLLACNGLTFHLDPPAAPDLEALRAGKGRR